MSIKMIEQKKRNISQEINRGNNNNFKFSNLYDIYKNEFIDFCENILLKKESEFLDNFYEKILLILKNKYGELTVENNKEFQNLISKCENCFYTEIYKKMLNLCQNTLRKYNMNKKSKENLLLVNFRTHCFSNQTAFHICKSKFLIVTEEKNKNKILYVICIGCKKCYYENSILMYCPTCKKEFYSLSINLLEKILPPATWEKYHCNAIINEQMSCIKCGDKFYLKNQYLFCKKCKFKINPLEVIWKCIFCKNEFKSFAKPYNPLGNKIIDISIKNAFLKKEIVKPKEMKCNCLKNEEIQNYDFYHKLNECNGFLYLGKLYGKDILICSKCKSINNLNNFNWICPKCENKFQSKNIIIITNRIENEYKNNRNQNIKKLNNFGNSIEYNGETDNSSGSNTKEVKNLKTIYHKEKSTLFELHKKLFSSSRDKINKRDLSINLIDPLNLKYSSVNNIHKKNNIVNEDNSFFKKNNNNEFQYPLKRNKEFSDSQKKLLYQITESNSDFKANNNSIKFNNFTPIKNISYYKSTQLSRNSSYTKEYFEKKNNDYNPIISIKKNGKYQSQEKRISMKFYNEIKKEMNDKNDIQVKQTNNQINNINNCNIKVKGNINKSNPNNILKRDTKLLEYLINSADKLKLKPQFSISNYSNQQIFSYSKNNSQELNEFNLDDYKILSQIGEGTFGKIYLVKDKKDNLFSMKKILISDEVDYHSIIKEYYLSHYLKHENIVKLLGIYNKQLDKTTFAIYILMEVGKNDWEKEIKQKESLVNYYSENELINIIKQLSNALSFLESNKISHRDIKPQNILIFDNNIYKIADFGEAKKIIYKNSQNTLRGTQLYMSPLLYNGLKNNQTDIKHNIFKSDVYSLGLCLLYSATLHFGNLYEIRKYSDRNSLKKFIENSLCNRYSSNFSNLLMKMLEINEIKRINFIELKKIMDKWK